VTNFVVSNASAYRRTYLAARATTNMLFRSGGTAYNYKAQDTGDGSDAIGATHQSPAKTTSGNTIDVVGYVPHSGKIGTRSNLCRA
jgi:hypothetical protein